VHIKMSGNVPAEVAILPLNIDYEYVVTLTQSADGKISAGVEANHDGFPGHELFLETDGRFGFKRSYTPTGFASQPFGATTAYPTKNRQMKA